MVTSTASAWVWSGPDAPLMPSPQRLEREDATVVTVVPRDGETPATVQPGRLDAKRRRTVWAWPSRLTPLPQTATASARALLAERQQFESDHIPVDERDRDTLI